MSESLLHAVSWARGIFSVLSEREGTHSLDLMILELMRIPVVADHFYMKMMCGEEIRPNFFI